MLSGMPLRFLSLLLLGTIVSSQDSTPAESPSPSSSHVQSTMSMALSVDDLWDLFVGPVETADITTTVEATPVPSSELIPPPPIYYGPNYHGAQVPLQPKNSSWAFPKDFFWGVASAAYQVEGAARDEGRGPSIWDVVTHRVTNFIQNNDTGDVADNQYYLYKQDIARIAALGIKHYSFSLSWSRIFPFGRGPVNPAGLHHYDSLIQTCLSYNVTPIVTLYHWDLPVHLQNTYGGWLSSEIIADFTEYARLAFTRWGHLVKHWITFNEPIVFCDFYPLPDNHFKATTSIPTAQQTWVCGHNVLLAHAEAYHLAHSLFPNATTTTLSVSLKNNGGHKIPLTNSSADAAAAERAWDFQEGRFANPLFTDGDYPPAVKAYVKDFLPDLTPEQKRALNGSSDIFADDSYSSVFVMAPEDGIDACVGNASHALHPACYNSTYQYDNGWLIGPAADPFSSWLHQSTDWVPAFLHYIQDRWNPAGGIAITEFGISEPFENLKQIRADILTDPIRSQYFTDYLEGILIALSEGVNVVGCLAWSIVDNFEWNGGLGVRFGLQYVNYTTQERFFKASLFHYVNMFKLYQEP